MAKATEKATAMHTPGIKLTEQITKRAISAGDRPFCLRQNGLQAKEDEYPRNLQRGPQIEPSPFSGHEGHG